MFKSIFNPFLSSIFATFLQNLHLNRKKTCFSHVSYWINVPELFAIASVPRGFSLWTVLRIFIVSTTNGDCHLEYQMVVDHFKWYLIYTLYIIHAWILSLIHQKIGLLIKFWLIYGVFWAYQHLFRLYFVTLPSNNRNLSWQS